MCRPPICAVVVLVFTSFIFAQTPDRSGWPFSPLNAPADLAADEAILRGAKIATDGPGLVEFFNKRVVENEAEQKQIDNNIQRLGSMRFQDREKAMADLITIGPPAKVALLRMADTKDPDVRRRVAECLAAIEVVTRPELESAALRVLRERKPIGACKALLAYLPTAHDPAIETDALAALFTLGVVDGKIDPDIVRATKDADVVRRAAAVLILARSGSKEQQEEVRQSLKGEPSPVVRLRAIQGLVAIRDKGAVAGLLPLLTDATFAHAEQARDLLEQIASDKAPTSELKENTAARKKCRDAWESWWEANRADLDLGKANVDLPWLDASVQARSVVLLFAKGLETRNPEMLRKSLGVPFTLSGFILLETRQDLEQMFIRHMTAATQPKVEFGPPQFLDTRQHLAKVGNDQQMAEFFKKIPTAELRVAVLSGKQDGRKGSVYVYIRLRGGKAHVVGIGMEQEWSK